MLSTLTRLLVLSVAATALALPTPSDIGNSQAAVERREVSTVDPINPASEVHGHADRKLQDRLVIERDPGLVGRSDNDLNPVVPHLQNVPAIPLDVDDLDQLQKRWFGSWVKDKWNKGTAGVKNFFS
ncbi:hypothetical protein PgNI_10491 [Pyricularia grisea]|uniref:Uncharacterized protein n=1 Tax=Pyricularia grisea TaxID=148305 RepID=A0A6P8AX45_PYRGI|nr:hypothetical protein PgNI_10491 [Pyricularia grisea]TLD06897.1 hypothetical protein PgNI_10491 [Pyricularia grisea]